MRVHVGLWGHVMKLPMRGVANLWGPLLAATLGGCSLLIHPDIDDLRLNAPTAGASGFAGVGGVAGMVSGDGSAGTGGSAGLGGSGVDSGVGGVGVDGGPVAVDTGPGGVGAAGGSPGGRGEISFQPSNASGVEFDLNAADLHFTRTETSFDTTACSLQGFTTRIVSQSSGPRVCVVSVRNLSVAAPATLRVRGEHGLLLLASGEVTIVGVIDAAATRDEPGPGGGRGGGNGDDGAGLGAAFGAPGEAKHGNCSGGGGGAHSGKGGAGGDLVSVLSLADGVSGGSGGVALTLGSTELRGGSGGGRGAGANQDRERGGDGDRDSPTNVTGGHGGGGGGAIQISALHTIRLTGAIWVGGGGGGARAGRKADISAGGGGGSAGMVLLEARVIDVGSTGRIGASGGGGGAADNGHEGDDGRGLLVAASGGAGVAAGGDAGGAATLDATDGLDVATLMLDDTDGIASGGGGGGAGRIVIRSANGILPEFLVSGASPTVAPGLTAITI